MPAPAQILDGLASISNQMVILATIWHVLLAIIIIALLMGWRPTRKTGAMALSIPLLSVSILAWRFKNPFNGAVFLIFFLILATIGLRLPKGKTQKVPIWATFAGSLMIIFGLVYPHFLEGGSWLTYLYAAPAGLIPCPTLSFIVGFALLANGFSSRPWSFALVIIGIFYSLFGALRLGVHIDFILLIGTFLLLVQMLAKKQSITRRAKSIS